MTTAGQRLAAADVIAKTKAKTSRVRIMLDGDLLDRHAVLSADLDTAAEEDKQRIAEEIVDVEAEMADAEVEFVQRGMGRARWRALLAAHPPSDVQKAQGIEFDPDTFPTAAIADSLIEPVMTVEQVRELEEHLDEVQFAELWGACLKANIGSGSTRPESQAARVIAANGRPKSLQPSGSESDAAS